MKALSQPFYDRLLSLGYTLGPLSSGTYPWVGNGLSPNDYAMGNIGQLKQLFSFDVTFSSANNGIPDWWVEKYFPGSTIDGVPGIDPGAFVAWSGTTVTVLQAFDIGLNPLDFYDGQAPTLSIISGTNQTGPPGGFVPAPLVVSVSDSNGNAIANAPVTFSVTSGTLQASSGGTPASSVTAFTDRNGFAQMFFKLPNADNSTSEVTVSTGTGSTFEQVAFSASSDNGTGQFLSPFAPSDCLGVVNGNGNLILTWTNNTDNETAIYIEQQQGSSGFIMGEG